MKKIKTLIQFSLLLCLTLTTLHSFAQLPDSWARKSDLGGIDRAGAVGFSIGNKGYVGTGITTDYAKDFWEYDPTTDSWSQKADFGGPARWFASGFSIGAKGYIGCGTDGTKMNDFWEYDPSTNIWTKKADFGGVPRDGAAGFSIGTKGYIGTGLIDATTRVNDFWEYDPSADTWTQKSNFGGQVRAYAAGFSIGNKGYIGTGNSPGSLKKDFWEYDPSNDTWIQKANFGGVVRFQAIGISTSSFGYIGLGDIGGGYSNDFWEYNPRLDTWTQKTNFDGSQVRTVASGFSISNRVYVGTGYDAINHIKYKDFWQYTPTCIPPTITSEPSTQSLTYGESVSYTISAIDAISYQWQEDAGSGFVDIVNGGIYSNATTGTLTISLPTVTMTNYKYRCVVTGDCLLTATSSGNAALTIASLPLTITADNQEKCEDGATFGGVYSVTFNGFIPGEDQTVLGGTLSIGGTAVTATTAGGYSIEPSGFTSSNYSISFVNGILVIKQTPTTPVIIRSGDTLISTAGTGNQWYKDGTEIIGSTDQKYLATSNGNYYVVVTGNGCTSALSNSISVLDVSIKEISSELFDIYPNPNNGIFNIKFKTTSNTLFNIEIYNNLGALVWKQENALIDGNNMKKINLKSSGTGLYTIVLRSKSNNLVKKVYITK